MNSIGRHRSPIVLTLKRCIANGTLYPHSTRLIHHPRNLSSQEIRKIFIEYFRQNDHQHVHSSPIIPKKSDGVYFVNAGMNQFKPLFLGTADPLSDMASYKRVVNSQKCVRVGGKHNDLDDVGRDSYHHTFFEMLGSWSFGDYFKKEACTFAWELLTKEYRLPLSRLYVTYFGGDETLGVEADEECREIWLELGVPRDRILPFGVRDNFWDMGDTGPCGPCTEIHYDHTGGQVSEVKDLVNADDPRVIELWNLVFMQFERQKDGSLLRLPKHHVDTGMGLERLTAVLQGSLSNYDSDLFQPIVTAIQKNSRCRPYRGRFGEEDDDRIDTAYRIVADHIRMITIAMSDGLVPGRRDLDYRLRQIMHRCFHQMHHILKAPHGLVSSLLPLVVESLGEAFPEVTQRPSELQDVIDVAEEKYARWTQEADKVMKKVHSVYNNLNTLPGQALLEMTEGKFGKQVPLDAVLDICSRDGVEVDIEGYYALMKVQHQPLPVDDRRSSLSLSQFDIECLTNTGVTPTDDHNKYVWSRTAQYEFQPCRCSVMALKYEGSFVNSAESGDTVGFVLDKTSLYAEAGGQAADRGTLKTDNGSLVEIHDVQTYRGYVLHIGTVSAGKISTGDSVIAVIDPVHRVGCMRAHTATHLINSALGQVLGAVSQHGSNVKANRLTFDFTCPKIKISSDDIREISTIVQSAVARSLPVTTEVLPLSEALSRPGVVSLLGETYPQHVRVVAIGDGVTGHDVRQSVELCGGTHVENTGDIEQIVITNFEGVSQGTKRVTAVTGCLATEAFKEAERVEGKYDELAKYVEQGERKKEWKQLGDELESMLYGGRILPKTTRDDVMRRLDALRMVAVLGGTDIDKPLLLIGSGHKTLQAICYVPENHGRFTAESWLREVTAHVGGTAGKAKNKKARGKDIHVLILPVEEGDETQTLMNVAYSVVTSIK